MRRDSSNLHTKCKQNTSSSKISQNRSLIAYNTNKHNQSQINLNKNYETERPNSTLNKVRENSKKRAAVTPKFQPKNINLPLQMPNNSIC